MKNVGVVVHGYSENVPPEGYRPWKDVVYDRLKTAVEVAEFFRKLGCEVDIIISGGTVNERGVTEAEAMLKYGREKFPELESYNVRLEDNSKNTAENIKKIYEMAKKEELDFDAIVPVSSKDHISRVMRDFGYHPGYNELRKNDVLVLGAPSQEAYSIRGQNGVPPTVIEPPAKLGEYYMDTIVGGFFTLKRKEKKEKRGVEKEAAAEIVKVLKKYGALQ